MNELPGAGFYGRRESAGEPFLFDAKKEAKKRHRFDAVDADQGCGFFYRAWHDRKNNTKCWFRYWSAAHSGQWLGENPCPTWVCGHLTTAYSPAGAGEQGRNLNVASGKWLPLPLGFQVLDGLFSRKSAPEERGYIFYGGPSRDRATHALKNSQQDCFFRLCRRAFKSWMAFFNKKTSPVRGRSFIGGPSRT